MQIYFLKVVQEYLQSNVEIYFSLFAFNLLHGMFCLCFEIAYTMYGVWPGVKGFSWWLSVVAIFFTIFVLNLLIGLAFVTMVEDENIISGIAGFVFILLLTIPQHLSHAVIIFIFPRLLWQHEGGREGTFLFLKCVATIYHLNLIIQKFILNHKQVAGYSLAP